MADHSGRQEACRSIQVRPIHGAVAPRLGGHSLQYGSKFDRVENRRTLRSTMPALHHGKYTIADEENTSRDVTGLLAREIDNHRSDPFRVSSISLFRRKHTAILGQASD